MALASAEERPLDCGKGTRAASGTHTFGRARRSGAQAAHPRVRGDLSNVTGLTALSVGSPPRARGPHARVLSRAPHPRFTPACAGTSRRFSRRSSGRAVHPRVRGDLHLRRRARHLAHGSPPRARGPHVSAIVTFSYTRFTPACAGTSRRGSCTFPRRSVHPRVRGDLTASISDHRCQRGSPPRARGPP